jgi:MFS family permease
MYQLEWVQQRVKARAGAHDAGRSVSVSRTVWLLGITSCLTDISSEMVNGILPLYAVAFLRLSPLQFGIIDGLYQGVSALVRLASGVLADRWVRYKEAAASGYALSAVCKLALLATGSSWPALASVIALDRTGKGIRTAPRDALITQSSQPESLATSFGVHRAMDAAGALIGPIVAFLILASAPTAFDRVFVISFAFAIIGAGVLVFFVEPTAAAPVVRNQPAPATASLRSILRGTGFGYLVIAASALSLATISDAFIYLTLQQRLDFAWGVFPLLYVATSLFYMLAAVPVGRLADRWGRRYVFLAGYGIIGIVYALLLLPSTGWAGAVLAIACLGLYYAATDGVLMALAGRMLPSTRCATGLAVLTTCTSLAKLLSSVAFGSIWTTDDVGTAVTVFGTALAIALVIAIVAMKRVDEQALHTRNI